MPDLWDKKYKCPVCGASVGTKKVFTGKVRIKSYEADLKPVYEGINPLLYSVIVCESCYYSALESDFETQISPIFREEIRKVQDEIKIPEMVSFSQERDHKVAIIAYALASLFYKVKNQPCRTAEMYLRMGWLYREINDEDNENKALAKALSNFEECYLNTYVESDKEPMILFYLAELSRRFGKREDAMRWFSTLVSKYKSATSFYVKAGKERWQELREK
ncbi:MAG TPA: DUF2225 domain-containing protein [Fervidobacterium sp.]|nr:DUF2225 domain-containing protein [Fervidobacterium sp.]HOM74123.1 DUF2225 domain-containing protein [Fervidobacterium sp.]HOQ39594.1 DUF2225 domain-containing protein [Fervidobacterium sp.]HPP17774.1 DUF2225 domain-containing protein [Fervidobacterium sp.]HPT54064.1 DUF2225 domain-containing protein [Fervidobacterium sp.]